MSTLCQCILIVEDNEYIRETMEDVLREEGYRVYAVRNGKEAIAALKRIKEPCLILLDMMMPVMNGWEFLEARKSCDFFAQLPVVVVSALGAASALNDKSAPIPAEGFIKKPIALNALLGIVKQYCGEPCDEKSQAEVSSSLHAVH